MNLNKTTCSRCGREIFECQAEITLKYLGESLCSPCIDDRVDEIDADYEYEQAMMQAEAEAEAMAQAEAEAQEEYYEEDYGGW